MVQSSPGLPSTSRERGVGDEERKKEEKEEDEDEKDMKETIQHSSKRNLDLQTLLFS